MSTFMRIGVVLAGILVASGCRKNSEAEEEAPPSAALEAPPNDAPVADAPPKNSELLERVKRLMSMRSVKHTDAGIEITFYLDAAATVNERSTPEEVADAMLFAAFYTPQLLYSRLPEMDGLQEKFVYKKDAIGEITMTRASYEKLNHPAAIQGAADAAAKRRVYQELLKKLPEGSVRIDEKYRP